MAKKKSGMDLHGWGSKRQSRDFDALVSPVGGNVEESNEYSPSSTVEGAAVAPKGHPSKSESAKDQRRGG